MMAAVAREERDAHPVQHANADCVAGRPERGFNRDLFNAGEAGHFIESRSAQHSEINGGSCGVRHVGALSQMGLPVQCTPNSEQLLLNLHRGACRDGRNCPAPASPPDYFLPPVDGAGYTQMT